MEYLSTRGHNSASSFSDILVEGLAPDGGLYVPKKWPKISLEELEEWRSLSYADLAAQVLERFMPEIPWPKLLELTHLAYSSEVFCHAREDSQTSTIFPIRQLKDKLYLLELSNGPTLAFKDAAMQMLARLLSYVLSLRDYDVMILGATSGDTGSAAIHAFRGREHIRVVMLSPDGRMSPFQRAQMYAVFDRNIENVAIRGGFDQCQDLVKALNGDMAFKEKHHLGTANSINFARIAAQCCYYIYAYLHVAEKVGDPVSFSVPTGNFGNAYAGLVAKMMGVPINRVVVTTNENDVLHRVLITGVYEPRKASIVTSSPSMDITRASNFERIVFEASGRNAPLVAEMWQRLREDGRLDLKGDYPEVWEGLQRVGLDSCSNDHQGRMSLIQKAKADWDIYMDPHTADGLYGALTCGRDGEPVVVLETAQAAKFAPTMEEALGVEPPVPLGFSDILSAPQRYEVLEDDVQSLMDFINDWDDAGSN